MGSTNIERNVASVDGEQKLCKKRTIAIEIIVKKKQAK